MPKLVNSEVTNDLKFVVDIQVPEKEYLPYKEKVIDQLVKTVDVKGFRKGNVPRKLALEKIDPLKLQTTILQESVEKFFAESFGDVETEIKNQGRVAIPGTAQLDPSIEHTKEDDKGNLNFRVSLSLLPEVNLEPITKLELEEPQEEGVDRLDFEEFVKRESELVVKNLNAYEKTDGKSTENSKLIADVKENIKGEPNTLKESKNTEVKLGQNRFPPEFETNLTGLKAGETKKFEAHLHIEGQTHADYEFEVTVHEVHQPIYTTIDEVIDNVAEAKTQLQSKENFEKLLKRVYDQESEQIQQTLRNRLVIRKIIEITPDFELPKSTIENEVERIVGVLRGQSVQQKKSLAEVFSISGLPGSEDNAKNDDEVIAAVEGYVKREIKLIEILRYIYYSKIEKKITSEDLEVIAKDIQNNPAKYNVSAAEAQIKEKALDIGFDRLLRDRAFNWVLSQVKFSATEAKKPAKETKEKSAKKEEKTEKKATKAKKPAAKKAAK